MDLGVLAQREFRLVFCAHGVSVIGDRMVAVALAFAVLEVGDDIWVANYGDGTVQTLGR